MSVNDLWPRSRNDTDLDYSQTFINSISCLYLQTFRSQATKLPEKYNDLHTQLHDEQVLKFQTAFIRIGAKTLG